MLGSKQHDTARHKTKFYASSKALLQPAASRGNRDLSSFLTRAALLGLFAGAGFAVPAQAEILVGGDTDQVLANGSPISGPQTSPSWDAAGDLVVGDAANGTLSITLGDKVYSVNGSIGAQAGSSGQVTVDGTGSTGTLWENSGLLYVGLAGDGSLSITGGGQVSAATGIIIGDQASSTSTVTVAGADSALASAGYLDIGRYGTGQLTLSGGGTATAAGSIHLGAEANSIGIVKVMGAGSALTAGTNLFVGFDGIGQLTLADGGKASAAAIILGNGASGFGALNIGDSAGLAGIVDAPSVTGGTGGGMVSFGHTASASPYYFTNTGDSGGTAVTLDGNLRVSNAAGYTILTGVNTYTGDTTISGGTLEVLGNLGSGDYAGAIYNNSALIFNQGTDQTLSGYITGGGSLTKTGVGALTLSGDNDYSGDTILNQGRINIGSDTALGGSVLTMDGGTTLGFTANGLIAANNIGLAGGSATIDTGANDAALSGVISGPGDLTKDGTGALTLGGANTYTGNTTITDGTLQVTGTLGAGGVYAGNIGNAGELVFNQTAAQTLSGIISGAGNLTKYGTGTLTLTGVNDYTGATTVGEGTLKVDGSIASSTLTTVNSGATLTGAGTTGDVTVEGGGILLAGAPGSVLTTGNLTLENGSFVNVSLGAPSTTGLFQVNGDLTLNGATLNVTNTTGFGIGEYRIIDYTGTLLNDQITLGDIPAGYETSTIVTNVANQISLSTVAAGSFAWWDTGAHGDGLATGGTGTWNATDANWTTADGLHNGVYDDSALLTFGDVGGTVTVAAGGGTLPIGDGLAFTVDGYTVTGDGLALTKDAIIQVGDGTSVGANMTATIESALSGASDIKKTDLGTLRLTGDSSGLTGSFTLEQGSVDLAGTAKLGGSFVQDAGTTLTSETGATLANATFNGTVTPTGTLNLTSGTFDTGAIVNLGLLTDANKIAATGNIDFAGSTTINVDATNVNTDSTYTLMSFGSSTTADQTNAHVVPQNLGTGYRAGSYFTATALDYGVITGAANLTWNGTPTASTWSTSTTTTNWNAPFATYFKNNDSVTFDAAAVSKNVTVDSAGVQVNNMTVTAPGYTFNMTAGSNYPAIDAIGNINFGGATLNIDLGPGTNPAINAGGTIDFGTGSHMNITGYTPGDAGSSFTSPLNVQTVVTSGTGISNFNPLVPVTVAGQTNADFLTASAYLSGNDIIVETNLTWYSTNPDRKANGTFTIADGQTFTLGAVLANNTATPSNLATGWNGTTLTKAGAGTLVLTAANTYTGGTTLSAGRIDVGNNSALGTGTLAMAANTALGFTGDYSLANAITLAGTGTSAPIVDTAGHNGTLSGLISGTGGLNKNGAGVLNLTGTANNTYSGGTNLNQGQINIGKTAALGTGTLTMAGGTTLGFLGSYTASNAITVNGPAFINVADAGTTGTLSGAITSTAGNTLAKTGAGTLALTATNTNFRGGMLLQEGRLNIGNASALGAANGTLYMADGTTLGFSGAYTLATPITLAAGTEYFDTGANATTISGIISGAGNLVKSAGTAALTLSGANTYTGDTTVNAGTLAVSGTLGAGNYYGNVSIASGATFQYSNNTAATTQNIYGTVTGAGTLTKTGASTLTLWADNSGHTGGTSLGGGVLNLANAKALGNSAVTLTAASTLGFLGNYTIANDISLGNYAGTFNTNGNDVTLTGALSSTGTSGALTKSGAGTLTLAGVNTYTGGTTVNTGGTLLVKTALNGGAYNGTVTINSGGSMVLDQTVNQTLSGALTNSGTLTKLNTNTLTLGGGTTAQNSTGLFDVQAGTVALAGTGPKTFTTLALHDGATFDASGTTAAVNVTQLNIYNNANWVGNLTMGAGKTVNFYLPATLADGGSVLNVTNGNVNVAGSTMTWGFAGNSTMLQVGSQIALIDVTNGTLSGTPASFTGRQGATLNYTMYTTETSNQLLGTIAALSVDGSAKTLTEGFVTGPALINQTGDLIADKGILQAVAATGGGKRGRETISTGYNLGAFGIASGGWNRYNTGSNTDLSSYSLMGGLAMANNIKPGRLTVGAFVEYGNGSYDTYNAFGGQMLRGQGDIDHIGGGVLGRLDFNQTKDGSLYLEAGVRAGTVSNDYKNGNLNGFAVDYSSDATYYGAHAALGYIWDVTDRTTLDTYGRYIWTRQDDDQLRLSTGDPINFGSVNSSRLRLGARFNYAVSSMLAPYIGAAYEHEFDGKSQATAYGITIPDTPSLQGGSGVGELGLALKPTKGMPLTVDVGVQGYIGIREGVTGSLQVRYDF